MAVIPRCPVCGADQSVPWFEKNGYPHWWCRECRFGFVAPVPDRQVLKAYYQSLEGDLSSDCSWETDAKHKQVLWLSLLSRIARYSGVGPLLDLGCGAGQFLRTAFHAGWHDLTGIEVSSKAVALARSAAAATIHLGEWQEFPMPTGHFAGVAVLDVLEHAPDVDELLRYVRNCLRPGGSLIITVPNARGVAIRSFGRKALVVVPPEHLNYFTAKSLALLLKREGFTVAFHTTRDIHLKEWLRFLPVRQTNLDSHGVRDHKRSTHARWYRRLTGTAGLRAIAAFNLGLAPTGLGDQLVFLARMSH